MVKIEKLIGVVFESSLSNLCEHNSSFDSAVLRICYSGLNRNGSCISKETLEKCLHTIYNCPIVCNYNREDDSLGGHDVEVVKMDDGFKLVNLTQPVGVIPESARVWFEDFEEEDGTKHEYLYADVLLWKRQEAYKKIAREGVVSHSMEISVKDGELVDGIYNIYDFEFTAFALIGCEPCFESSALETFSNENFKKEYREMLKDLKDEYSKVITSEEEDYDIHPQKSIDEEGGKELDDKLDISEGEEVITIDASVSTIDTSISTIDVEFSADNQTDPTAIDAIYVVDDKASNDFALESSIRHELIEAINIEVVHEEWGEYPRYMFIDYSPDKCEVYAEDSKDWKLYGFAYEQIGDKINVDFESKKRVKFEIVDFDGGEPEDKPEDEPIVNHIFEAIVDSVNHYYGFEGMYNDIASENVALKENVEELKKFKSDTEALELEKKKEELFNKFSDLIGIESFDRLVANNEGMSIDDIEEKCFAIRGRNGVYNYSHEVKAPKIIVNRAEASKEPYGGLFTKYGFNK